VGKEAEVVVEAPEHHPLDQVAKELSNPTVSRRRALKLMVGALVGGAGLALIPGVASAAPPPHANAGGRFGSSDTCSGVCSTDSDCGAGCLCACPHAGGAYWTCVGRDQKCSTPPPHANAGGKYGSSAPPEHAQDKTGFGAGGRFGPGGAPRNYCGGTYICGSNRDCAGGCTCSCQQNIKNIPTSICC
jgi:hypothetical protein